jgi:endonuclease/exonuclease/phosphatase family metal-dependent hydrolase
MRPLSILCSFLAAAGIHAAPPAAESTPPANVSRVVTYNIKHGRGMDGKLDLDRTAEAIRKLAPDLVALQEVDLRCGRSGGVDQMAALGKTLGMHHAFGKFMDFDGGEYGLGILSKHPILRSKPHRLPDGAEPRCALEVEVEIAGRRVSFVCIHLDWTSEELRLAQAKALVEKLADRKHPVFLLGDFNAPRDSDSHRLLTAQWTALGRPGAANTFPSDAPGKEIDFILVPKGSPWEKLASEVIDDRLTSDHRPVLAELPF